MDQNHLWDYIKQKFLGFPPQKPDSLGQGWSPEVWILQASLGNSMQVAHRSETLGKMMFDVIPALTLSENAIYKQGYS